MPDGPAASFPERIAALAQAARSWRDPDHAARAEAVERTLEAAGRFTPEALAFAVNAAMHRLTPGALRAWAGEYHRARGPSLCTVGAFPSEGVPLAGLRELGAVLLVGHRYLGVAPSNSGFLLEAFAEELRRQWAEAPVAFAESEEAVFERADALLGGSDEETRTSFERRADAAGIPKARRWWRAKGFAVAVLDGSESEEEREGLAEDALLYAGRSVRSVRVVWAPAGLPPDVYLEAMAHFRAVFPPPPELAGALEMQRAFLEAQDRAFAHGEGLEFLMSRGAPAPQPPGHVRWAEYESLGDIEAWLRAEGERVRRVVAHAHLAERLTPEVPCIRPGTAHRPPLDTPESEAVLAFLAGLEG